ncbi:MAG TPA: GlsB/YeaQ/YmgE family stress response membrane protein [Rubrobacter sp.]|nr:GlsB/YeaQ/YmgE family stress response membrane protein [Rubrobacter sp.]
MGIISWIVVGLIAGLLAKLVVPGEGPGGLIVTTIIGMIGAVVGGALIGLLGGVGATGLNVWSVLVATLGAILLLFVYRLFTGSHYRTS